MNPGIYYLYEYADSRRVRNVGFIKVSRRYRSCILQIRAQGMPPDKETDPILCAFYFDGGGMTGSRIAVLKGISGSVSARLSVSEASFPGRRSLEGIDGFLIRMPETGDRLFWMASPSVPDPGFLHYREEPSRAADPQPEPEQEPGVQPKPVQEPDVQPGPGESLPQPGEVSASETARLPAAHVTRIDRSGIRRLPRKFWPLANNSFLLHGCHCYGHLLLLEEDGRVWLGVPGIYDAREARAADLFGFPRFTCAYAGIPALCEEERSDHPDFGHWLRCVGPASGLAPDK